MSHFKYYMLALVSALFTISLSAQTDTCMDADSPTAYFTISGCPAADMPLQINNMSTNADEYLWLLSNGDEYTGENPEIILSYPGYYCIELIVSNECGQDSYNLPAFYVNASDCPCNYDYDFDDETIVSYTDEHTWSPDDPVNYPFTSYQPGDPVFVEGDIIIETGTLLHIYNLEFYFGPEGRIIVEEGAKLFMENCTLTNIPPCNNMWKGIEVHGNPAVDCDDPVQGEIYFGFNNTIKHAHIGILSGARNDDIACIDSPDAFDLSKAGGVIIIDKGPNFFENNGIGVKYLPKDPPYEADCNSLCNMYFSCDGTLNDAQYNSDHPDPYPNAQNPWAGYANANQRTDVGIWMAKQKDMGSQGGGIRYCEFDNLQHGILSFDSKYNVFNCRFTNAHFGIKINNVNSGVDFNHEISRCFFDRIPGYEPPTPPYYFKWFTAAIYIRAGKNDYIHDNTFGHIEMDQELNQYGIFTNSTSSFRITENIFKKFKHGIKINNSGDDGGFIGAEETQDSYWNGNVFNSSWRSISTGGDNSKLKIKCNVSDNNLALYQPELYDVNYKTYGVLADQGYPPYQGWQLWNERKPAGNEFYPPEEPDYKTLWSNYSYTYYRHTGPPEVIPYVHDESQEWINIDGTNSVEKPDNDVACPPAFLIAIPLDPIIISGNPGGLNYPYNQLDSLKQVTDSLKLVLEDINASLDNGKTYELLDAIYGNTPPGKLKNKLIKNSPLSDTVIHALLTEYPLPHGNFKNVMDLNLPVRKDLRSLFYSVLQQIPQGIANQLYALQANYPGSISPGKIEQEIDNTEMERQLLLNHLLILLNDTIHNRREDAIFLLENEESLSAEKTLISTYIADGDYDLAASKLDALPTDDPDNADFVTLHQMLLSHYEQGNTLHHLDSSEIELIRTLAYQCPVNLASTNAQSILYYLFREVIPGCPAQMGTKNMPLAEEHPVITGAKRDNPVLEDNYPDPATDYTIIPYYLPEGSRGKIEIHDLQGKLLSSYKLSPGKNQVYANTEKLYPGVYLYSLDINGVTYITKKFVVQ
ncbi:MAG: T9SS type A sorting domain-containing protein [Bacteroidales bacterium]